MKRALAAAAVLLVALAGVATAATLRGNGKGNRIAGTNSADKIDGRGGNDRLYGKAGNDDIKGRKGNDRLKGGPGNDLLEAGDGNDQLNGGDGDDDMHGGGGNDEFRDGAGSDVIKGGEGSDLVLSRDNSEDLIDCGGGVDTAVLDESEDGVYDCEELRYPPEEECDDTRGADCPAPAGRAAARAKRFWLGDEFEGLSLTHDEDGLFVYGDCDPGPGEGGCSPPLQVQNKTACERNPVGIDLPPRRLFRLRDGGIVSDYSDGFDVLAGRSGFTVFANRRKQARRALGALRPRGAAAPVRLERPQLPFAVLLELKRVSAAWAGHRSVKEIGNRTGVSRWRVRTWLRLGTLLGREALEGIPVPELSWRAVRQYRQVAFLVSDLGVRGAAKHFDLAPAEVRRRVQRVRGLTGEC